MTNAFQGLASKLAKLKHDAEFEAGKLDAKVEGVAAKMPGVFSRAHGHVDGLAQNLGDVESFVNEIEALTNGGPALDDHTALDPKLIHDAASSRPGQGLNFK